MQRGYKIDGNDLASTYGVYVQKTRGALDFLKRKGVTAHSWPDEDGEEAFTDSGDIFFEPRDIILSCFIKADTKANFFTNLNSFKAKLAGSGLHSLTLPCLPISSPTISVYYKDGGALDMLTGWNGSACVGKFMLKLREPNPS